MNAPIRTLVISGSPVPTEDLPPGFASLTWGEAQAGGYRSFRKFARFLGFRPLFPAGVLDHERERMLLTLRARVEDGATLVQLVPAVGLEAARGDGLVEQTRQVVEAVTRLRPVPQEVPGGSAIRLDPACPLGIASAMPVSAPAYRLEAGGTPWSPDMPRDTATVLAEHDGSFGDPVAVIGFAGAGVWLVMPTAGATIASPDAGDMGGWNDVFVDLERELEALNARSRRAPSVEADTQARELTALRAGPGDRAVERTPDSPRPSARRGTNRRTLSAPLCRVVRKMLERPKGFVLDDEIQKAYGSETHGKSIVALVRKAGIEVESFRRARAAGKVTTVGKGWRLVEPDAARARVDEVERTGR